MKEKKKAKEWSPDPYLKSAFRKVWRWSPARRACLKLTRCNNCGKKAKEIFADHVMPVVDLIKGFENWQVYYDRMFKGALQPLCEKCHSIKTKAENAERRKIRNWKWPFLRMSDGKEYGCPHGIGHSHGVHGCDGCCSNKSFPKDEK